MKNQRKKDKNENLLLTALFIVALLLRLIPAIWFSQAPTDDASNYQQIALNLTHGNGFSFDGKATAFREPLLPFLASLIYQVFGEDAKYVYAFQSILSALTVLIVFRLGMELFNNRKAAWFAALITTIYPNFILYSKILLTETLITFLLVTMVWSLIRAVKTQQLSWYVLGGLLLGGMVLTKAAFVFFIPFLALYFVIFYWKGYKPVKKGLALFFLISLLLVGAWTLRNYSTFHQFIPVVNRGGTALFYGVYIPYNNMYQYSTTPDNIERQIIGNETDPGKLDDRFYAAAKQYVFEHPVASFFFYIKKMFILWYGPADSVGYPLQHFVGDTKVIYEKPLLQAVFGTDIRVTTSVLLYVGIYWILILLALYTLLVHKKNKIVWLAVLPIIYGTLFYSLVLVTARYKEPLLPLVFALSGYGWTKRKEIWKKFFKF